MIQYKNNTIKQVITWYTLVHWWWMGFGSPLIPSGSGSIQHGSLTLVFLRSPIQVLTQLNPAKPQWDTRRELQVDMALAFKFLCTLSWFRWCCVCLFDALPATISPIVCMFCCFVCTHHVSCYFYTLHKKRSAFASIASENPWQS